MRRRMRGRSSGGVVVFGVILALIVLAVVVELLKAFSWVLLFVAGIAAAAWLARSLGAGGVVRPAPPAASAPTLQWAKLDTAPAPAPRTPPPDAWHPVPTLRGEWVRSRAEARIADLLHRSGIDHEYEPTICGFRPDFHLPQWNLIIEYWGMTDEGYLQRRRVKTSAFLHAGYHLVSLEPADWPRLEEELKRRLYRFDKDIYRRAPAAA